MLDPYALSFSVATHFLIIPWVRRHLTTPHPKLPASVKLAAVLLVITGGLFALLGVVCGVLFTDLSRLWRFLWITVAGGGGALWVRNAFRLTEGVRSAQWGAVPFLVAALPCLPVLGWIASPIAAYCLFLEPHARQFFWGEGPACRAASASHGWPTGEQP